MKCSNLTPALLVLHNHMISYGMFTYDKIQLLLSLDQEICIKTVGSVNKNLSSEYS